MSIFELIINFKSVKSKTVTDIYFYFIIVLTTARINLIIVGSFKILNSLFYLLSCNEIKLSKYTLFLRDPWHLIKSI